MPPLVSVIIPVYNTAPRLARCIESVRRQTYRQLEILLVNDGSRDASLAICNMYAGVDNRIRVIDKANSGVSATRNLAIAQATGDYLQFVDSDDYLAPNATELLVDRALSTGSDLVIAHYWRVTDDEPEAEQSRLPRWWKFGRQNTHPVYGFLTDLRPMDTRQFARHLMDEPASFYYGVMWNKLYRADIIRCHHLRCSEELAWSEDFLFNLQFIRYAQRFCALTTPIYYYVKNPTSITATQIDLKSVVEVKRSLFAYYKNLYEELGLYDQYRLRIHKYLVATAET